MGRSARSRGLHSLQKCFCGDVSVNSTQDSWVSCKQERVKPPSWNKRAGRTCSSSLDDALACQTLLQLKLQALSSGLGCGERDRYARFTHPSPVTSCCRKRWWRAASASYGRDLQALNSSLFLPNLLQFPPHSPSNTSSSSLPLHSGRDTAHSQLWL